MKLDPVGAGGPPPTPAAPLMSVTAAAAIGATMVVVGPISFASFTPAMPTLVTAFGTSSAMVKLTLTIFFLGYAFSQLFCGPLSDAYGRRPVAIGFFGVYLLGSAMAVVAPTILWLIVARALQGIGCAAGIAISRAIVRDQFTGQASARVMTLIGTMLAVGPAVAPSIGGLLLGLSGWHAIFLAMAGYGVLLVVLLVFFVPETNRFPDPALSRPSRMIKAYGELMRHRAFMRAGLVMGFGVGGIYTLASILPFVLIGEVGLTAPQFGLAMVLQTGFFMLGSIVTGRLLDRVGAARLVTVGTAILLSGAFAMALSTHILAPSVASVMLPVGIWAFAAAFLIPGCTTAALADFPHMAGAAAALTGFLQIGGGFLGSSVSVLFASPLVALTVLVPAMGLCTMGTHLLLAPRARDRQPVAEDITQVSPSDFELAADPLGMVGAAGDEVEMRALKARD